MNISLPKEILPQEATYSSLDPTKPEVHTVKSYTLSAEEMNAYFMERYGYIPGSEGKKPSPAMTWQNRKKK